MKFGWLWEYLRLWLVRLGWLRPRLAKPVQYFYPYCPVTWLLGGVPSNTIVRGLPPAYKWDYTGDETVVSAQQDDSTLAVWSYPTAEDAAKARARIKKIDHLYDMAIITAGERMTYINNLRAEVGLEPLQTDNPDLNKSGSRAIVRRVRRQPYKNL
jgi:hypothetical protein